MSALKKYGYFLFFCSLFITCKSTDCGCPMADKAGEKIEKEKILNSKINSLKKIESTSQIGLEKE